MGAMRNEWDSKSFFSCSFTETEKFYRESGKRSKKEGLQSGRKNRRKEERKKGKLEERKEGRKKGKGEREK